MFGKLTDRLNAAAKRQFDYDVIDEAQDLSVNKGAFSEVSAGKKQIGFSSPAF